MHNSTAVVVLLLRFFYSIDNTLLSTYYVPGPVFGVGDEMKGPGPHGLVPRGLPAFRAEVGGEGCGAQTESSLENEGMCAENRKVRRLRVAEEGVYFRLCCPRRCLQRRSPRQQTAASVEEASSPVFVLV